MKKRIILIVLALAAIGVTAAFLLRRGDGTPPDRIRVSGNIELTQVDIAFKAPGRLVERGVDEGDPVRAGQVVARLDREQLERQREREQAALALAQAQLAQAQTAAEWMRRTLGADLQQRGAELRSAEARLRELKTGSRPEEIREAQAAVTAARAEAERAAKDWERAQALFKNDDISAAQHDQFRTRYESAQAALRQASQRAALVEEGPRRETIEAAAAQVERARAALKAGEANELELRRREQEITARRAEIERARAQIAWIDAQLSDTVAVSPIGGVVLVKSADVGEVLAAGTTVLIVGDIDRPWLRGYINERDLGRVKIGAPVRVTTDSFPGKVYNGRVSFIASEAEFTPKQIQTQEERVKLVYRIKIDVENPRRELKSNMPADAEILLSDERGAQTSGRRAEPGPPSVAIGPPRAARREPLQP